MSWSSLDQWQPLFAIVVLAVAVTWLPAPRGPALLRRFAEGPALPALLAAISAYVLWYLWGGLDPVPYIHDESAYLLQAEIFTHGHFTGAARPLPEFFTQFHVFVTPVLAAKYPPGWGFALAPGVMLGLPALVPITLFAASAALLVIVVRRLVGSASAVLAWVLWVGAPLQLRFRPSFLSEPLTTFLWIVGWWALWRWREERGTRWLALLSVATAWAGITRPLTAIAFALPVGVVVLMDVRRHRLWRQLAVAVAAGLPLCIVFAFQARAITGRWAETPMKAYASRYMPWDLPGFGVNSARPSEALDQGLKDLAAQFRPTHAAHLAERLPQILGDRVTALLRGSSDPGRSVAFAVLVLLGLIGTGPLLAFGGFTCATLILLYLTYAHPANWTVYYMEGQLVLAVAAAAGVGRLAAFVARNNRSGTPSDLDLVKRRAAIIVTLVAAWVAYDLPGAVRFARHDREADAAPIVAMHTLIDRIPGPAIVFVRNAPTHQLDRDLIANHFDLEGTPVWTVHDLGIHNADLMRLAPGRTPFLYDEARGAVLPLAPDGVAAPAVGPAMSPVP